MGALSSSVRLLCFLSLTLVPTERCFNNTACKYECSVDAISSRQTFKHRAKKLSE
jgi:hypothetical protein